MKKIVLTGILFCILLICSAQQIATHKSLDAINPVVFGGDFIIYHGKTIQLGPKALYIDGQFSDAEAAKYSFIYNSVNKAVEHLIDGTEESPMVLYIAPYVYWVDDPDDPAVRVGQEGQSPYALTINCEWLRFYGLSDNADNVVLACNRGQTIGSQGNFTMFGISGQGTSSENITFGNYCNVDLVYPLKPELGRKKRASAIVQAQLIYCNGDKIVARNTKFISRLNLMPFVGGKRVLFDRCHFECTDDALCATGVYLNSTFDFYSSKPFYATTGTGAVLMNCDITSLTRGVQYFTKGGGQVTVVDTRVKSEHLTNLGWRDNMSADMHNYQYNVSLNSKQILIGEDNPASTVDMTNKPLLEAYRISYNGKVVYNTYNLLRGNDDWDPMGIKDTILLAEKKSGRSLSMIPVQLLTSPSRGSIETGKNKIKLTAKALRFSNCDFSGESIKWSVAYESESLVQLKVSEDGLTCQVIPTNNKDQTFEVIVNATTPSGLQSASILTVVPPKLEPPRFISLPVIRKENDGKLKVDYKLEMRFEDQSIVTWYRCTDENGGNPKEVAVSRLNKPMRVYELSAGDIGYFIMASVEPKHLRCDAGTPVTTLLKERITANDVKADKNLLRTNFQNVPTRNQPEIIPGFWTFTTTESPSGRQVSGTEKSDAWYWGEGTDGSAGQMGLMQGRNARLLYTPVGKEFGDMKLSMIVVPSKTAGQGFSVAPLYMDVLIKFDTKTMTGFALRFIRTTKYHDAVDCIFVKYENGKVTEINKPVSTSCFRPSCNITLEVKNNKIFAHADSPADYYKVPGRPEVLTEVNMEADINPRKSGGFGIEYTGGAATMIKEMKVEWK